MSKVTTVRTGIIPGGIIAAALSFALNKSIFWAILHYLCGYVYVLYWLFKYTRFAEWVNTWVQ